MNPYKIGDRIKFIKDCDYDGNFIPKGATGVVIDISNQVRIKFDNPEDNKFTFNWWLPYTYITKQTKLKEKLKEFIDAR